MLVMPSHSVKLKLVQVNEQAFTAWFNKERKEPVSKDRMRKIIAQKKRMNRSYTGNDSRGVILCEEYPGHAEKIALWMKDHGFKCRVLKKEIEAII